ncbi:MAG: protein-L-isoaspartate(D-aspartate) O-methyltransferase [bacterium]
MQEYFINKENLLISFENRGIDPKVIRAIAVTPRELFVPKELEESSYDDRALPIGYEQTISQPFTVAYMTTLLDIQPENKILEIGTGSGYQTAILYNLAKNIYTIERIHELMDIAKKRFKQLEIAPKTLKGDGTKGWAEFAPFDRIIVTAAAKEIPYMLIEQLAYSGIMVIPVGGSDGQVMQVVKKDELGNVIIIKKDQFRFVPLISNKNE